MSTSGDPVSSNPMYNSNGVMSGSNMGIGDTHINMQNEGLMDPHALNPMASQYTDRLNGLSQHINDFSPGSDYYKQMMGTQQQNLMTGMGNQWASMGLGGSSAELGGMNQAMRQNQMAWIGKQQQDAMAAARMQQGLDQAGYNQTMGIQGQYGQFQDTANQNQLGLLGLQEAQKQGNQNLWGGIAQAGVGAAGRGAAAYAGGG